jgi:pyruvate,water dikinase
MEALARSDPLIGDALQTIVERDGFVRPLPDEDPPGPLFGGAPDPIETDPAIVTELIERTEASIAARNATSRRCPERRCSNSSKSIFRS